MMSLWDVLERFNYMNLVGVDVIDWEVEKWMLGWSSTKTAFCSFVSDNWKGSLPTVYSGKTGSLFDGRRSQYGPNFQHFLWWSFVSLVTTIV